MKNLKKLTALLIAVFMVFSMIAMVGAADPTYDLFVKNDAPNHTYDAYQIFSGKLSADGTTLSSIEWGSSIADPEALITALTTDTKEIELANSTTTLSAVFAKLTTAEVEALPIAEKAQVLANEIANNIHGNDSATLDRFAEIVGAVVYAADGSFQSHTYLGNAVASANTQSQQDGATGYAITGLPAGYYLIKDRDGEVTNEGDFYSKYMISVIKSSTITVKGEGVKVTKTVNDTLDGTYNESEDAYINQTLFYKWEGTLPNNLLSYDTYNYKFIDTMAPGLTFVRYEKIYIENTNGSVAYTIYDAETDDALPAGVVATDPATDAEGNITFALEIEDLLATYPSILPSQKVIVKYTCYLNRSALIAEANTNEVKVEYDNNPNGEGTGTTVPDEADAYTFKVDVDKYDASDANLKLEGVEFILYFRDTVGDATTYHYAQVITEEMVEAGTEINGKVVTDADVGVIYGYTENRDDASTLDTDANGAIYLKGLDAGIYYLEETKEPDGYNKLDTPIQVEIAPEYNEGGDLLTVKYEVDNTDQGNLSTVSVANSKGNVLPSTGGMGTTLLYIVGAVLVLSAGLVLITKKRLANEQ